MTFTKLAREEAAVFWDGSFSHPFIQSLAAGDLAPEIFRYYLLQDRYYLEHFSKLYHYICLLYTSPSPRDATLSRMPSSA